MGWVPVFPAFPMEKMLLGYSSFAARSSRFPGRIRAWKSLAQWENIL